MNNIVLWLLWFLVFLFVLMSFYLLLAGIKIVIEDKENGK